MSVGTAGLAPDGNPRKLLPQALGTGAKGRRESSPKPKQGPPAQKQRKPRGGLLFRPPPRSGGLGTLGERGQLTQVSALWTLSSGERRKPNDATPTAPSRWGPGTRNPPPWFLCRPCYQGWLGLCTGQLLGFQQWTHSRGATSWGRTGVGGTQICETCTFSKEEEEAPLGLGLAWEGRADTRLLDLGSRSLLPAGKAGDLGEEGGRCWVPTKAREA